MILFRIQKNSRGESMPKIQSKMMNGVRRYYIILPNGRWKFVKKP